MRWVERVNGNGVRFRQWQPIAKGEKPPVLGEDTMQCPICGEWYDHFYLQPGTRQPVPSSRWYIYHDPVRHRDYMQDGLPVMEELKPMREPGE